MFEKELNESEIDSIDEVERNIDQIHQSVFQKNKSRMSAASLGVYKTRVLKVIRDYKQYGTNPTQMANWVVKTITRERKSQTEKKDASKSSISSTSGEITDTESGKEFQHENMARFELPLRPSMKFIVIVPRDISSTEISIIKNLLESLNPDLKK